MDPQVEHDRLSAYRPHDHTHGVVDQVTFTSGRGISAVQWSFFILTATAFGQFVVVLMTGSVALLADTMHNAGDALTAIPLMSPIPIIPPIRIIILGLALLMSLCRTV